VPKAHEVFNATVIATLSFVVFHFWIAPLGEPERVHQAAAFVTRAS
jgi:hypothetical protein